MSTTSATRTTPGRLVTPDLRDLLVPGKGTMYNRAPQLAREGHREVVRFDAREGPGLAWWHDVAFDTGTIAFEVRGKNVPQHSFVGVAFHGEQIGDEPTYDAVYFRPFNFLADDPERRAHMVQYESEPAFPWHRLREERHNQFEASVDPIPDPNGWFAARIEVGERMVRVYVAGSETASLEVERLSDRRGGWVGYWVGNNSDGDFAGLTLTPAPRS